MIGVIEKKKSGKRLTDGDIRGWIAGVTDGSIPDYQSSALLMAICIRGMDADETAVLTAAMAESGDRLDLSSVDGIAVDKHSTGGVSDATSLIVVPILAALGLKVAKMSGRGLGFTGGTLDKLEAFTGYNVFQPHDKFLDIVNTVGASIVGADRTLAPADKTLYALRDVTATVDSIPLIAASIMSKKLAGGAGIIVLDVKYGSGAFMKDVASARVLADCMVSIGQKNGRKTDALITSMAQPLGEYIGSNLEARGAVEVLKGKQNDLYRVSVALCEKILTLTGAADCVKKIEQSIYSGAAYQKLEQIVFAHGGTVPEWKIADFATDICAEESGFLQTVDCGGLGRVNNALGGGRAVKDAPIDHAAGLRVYKRIGDSIKKGDVMAVVYAARPPESELIKNTRHCFRIGETKVCPPALIL